MMTARCAQYVSALKIVTADDCARISTLQSYHYSAVKLFSKYSINVIAAPNDLNVLDGQTDRRTLLWHHCAMRSIAQ